MEQFISRCLKAARGDKPAELIAEIVRDTVAVPHSIVEALGEPGRATLLLIHCLHQRVLFMFMGATFLR